MEDEAWGGVVDEKIYTCIMLLNVSTNFFCIVYNFISMAALKIEIYHHTLTYTYTHSHILKHTW